MRVGEVKNLEKDFKVFVFSGECRIEEEEPHHLYYACWKISCVNQQKPKTFCVCAYLLWHSTVLGVKVDERKKNKALHGLAVWMTQ